MRLLLSFLMAVAMVVTVYAEPAPLSGPLSGQGMDISDPLQSSSIVIHPAPSGQIEEYRRGGQLYMIKVTPEKGVSYYLVDSDGDGRLDTRRNELDSDFVIPQWVLKRW